MWSSRLFWKLFLTYGAIYVAVSLTFVILESQQNEKLFINQARQRLLDVAGVLRSRMADNLRSGTHDGLQRLIRDMNQETQLRLTIIADDGEVIADSREDPRRMENHLDRPELAAAARSGVGEYTRRSPTLGVDMMYYAVAVRHQGESVAFIRVSVAIASLDRQIGAAQRFLWMIAVYVGLVTAPISYFLVGHIVRPLAEITSGARAIAAGDYRHSPCVYRRDELGELARAVETMKDELANRISQLQAYGDRLAAVLGGMLEGVLAVDSENRMLLANDACRELLGIKADDIAGLPLLEVTRNLDIQAVVSTAVENELPTDREVVVSGPPRRVLHLLAARLPGEPSDGCVVVLNDVTELRHLENVRRDFVANVSHELKTPLASIKAYAETLRMGAVNDPEHNLQFVNRIEEQAQRLHQLIVDLLHLSRVESGRQAYEFTIVSLADAVQQTVEQHREVAAMSGIQVHVEAGSDDACVWVDRQGIFTMLDNLIDNAIKYTSAGGRVTVRWRVAEGKAVLEIQDTGIGIAPEDQQRIFERFYRVDKARSRELGGTGLGLAIVKHLAQAFSGDIGLTSEMGVGTTFRVRLPLAPAGDMSQTNSWS